MEIKPTLPPLWSNVGEKPDDTLFSKGYSKLDVPYSYHLNYMFNQITSSFRYFNTGKVHNLYGVFTSGQPVPLSEEGVGITVDPHEIAYRGFNWYKVTRKDPNTKEITLNITYPNAFDSMSFPSSRAAVYSVLVHITEPISSNKKTSMVVTGVDGIWSSAEVTRLEANNLGTDMQLVPYRITLKAPYGVSKPTISNLKMKLIISVADGGLVESFEMLRPVLYEGISWFGNMNSLESTPANTKEVFGFYDSMWNDPIKAPSLGDAPLGVSRITTPVTGAYSGLPNSAKGVLFNMAGYSSSSPGAQLAMVDKGVGTTPELYFRTTTAKSSLRDYSRVMTDTLMTALLKPYATKTYVDTQLAKYITKTEAEATFIKKEDTDNWQKNRITKDDGSPLHVLVDGTEQAKVDFISSLGDSLGTDTTSITSVSIPGSVIWGDGVTAGFTRVTDGPVISYTERGSGIPVYLNRSSTPLVGYVKGGIIYNHAIGMYVLSGELSGHVLAKTTSGETFEKVPISVKVSISVDVDKQEVVITGWGISDSTAQAGAFQVISGVIARSTSEMISGRVIGDVLYTGNVGAINSTISLSKSLDNYTRLTMHYTDGTNTYVETIHLPSIRDINVTISLQMQRITPDLTECYVYEINIGDGSGNVYTGKSLTITGNKRYALKAGKGVEGTYTRITKIVGLK